MTNFTDVQHLQKDVESLSKKIEILEAYIIYIFDESGFAPIFPVMYFGTFKSMKEEQNDK